LSDPVVQRLLESNEPSVRYQLRAKILRENPASPEMQRLREEIRTSPRVRRLLLDRDAGGNIPNHPYAKWYGAHWVLASLADLGYPPRDATLFALREQELTWLLGKAHQKSIRSIEGRVRRCASIEANALYSLLALDLADERDPCREELASRLRLWQWPDGGWNCDKNSAAVHSSFHESLIPLRALALHSRVTGDERSQAVAEAATELFLKRRLFRTQRDGSIIQPDFVRLHYPNYWHYDVLFGLVVMAEAGFLGDPRCGDALDLLESKRLPDGGFPAEQRYYQTAGQPKTGYSRVDWGGTSTKHMNEWVTLNALYVLTASGRLSSLAPAP